MASVFLLEKPVWKWKACAFSLVSSWGLTAHRTLASGCEEDEPSHKYSRRSENQDNTCWYKIWYFWFIAALVLIIIIVMVVFYCKNQVKRSSCRNNQRVSPTLTMPTAPPEYHSPGHQPPPYQEAVSMPTHPATGVGQPMAPTIHGSVASHPETMLPGSFPDYDNISVVSTLSGTFSNPPPYSPPHTAQGAR